MKNLKIGNKQIGEGELCFIIAEAGSNHNGSLEQAKKLIDVAVEAGADAVKFQIGNNTIYCKNNKKRIKTKSKYVTLETPRTKLNSFEDDLRNLKSLNKVNI